MEDMNESFISSKTASQIVHRLPLASNAAKTELESPPGILAFDCLVAQTRDERGAIRSLRT